MEEFPVKLYIYDLSKGLAKSMSMALLGRQLEGIWHTGVVAYGQEFFYGSDGISSCPPSGTILGEPDTKHELGVTQIPLDMFMDYLQELGNTNFRPESYHLFDHNCNTFSNEVAQFLTGKPIPSHITNLPQEVLNTPFGAMIKPFIDSMSVSPGGGHPIAAAQSQAAVTNSLPNAQCSSTALSSKSSTGSTPASKDESSESKSPDQNDTNAAAEENASASTADTTKKPDPVTYTDEKALENFQGQREDLENAVGIDDVKLLDEVYEFLSSSNAECLWSLGPEHVNLFRRILTDEDAPVPVRAATARLLQQAVLHEDILSLLRFDRDHNFMKVMQQFPTMSEVVQKALARTMCNCCSCKTGVDWTMSSNEWQMLSQVTSNTKITTKLCVGSLLHDNPDLNCAGAGIAFNLTRHQISEEATVEVGSALIQALSKDMDKESAEKSLSALLACMKSSQEVTGLAAVMGVDYTRYKSVSPICEPLCNDIHQRMQGLALM